MMHFFRLSCLVLLLIGCLILAYQDLGRD